MSPKKEVRGFFENIYEGPSAGSARGPEDPRLRDQPEPDLEKLRRSRSTLKSPDETMFNPKRWPTQI